MGRKRSDPTATKKRNSFADILSRYKTYDTSQGMGSVDEWRQSWKSITGKEAIALVGDDDPFAILGILASASKDEIKRAYRTLAMQNHPDRHPDDPEATNKFKKIVAAYEVVMERIGDG